MRSICVRIVGILCLCGSLAAFISGCESSETVETSGSDVSMGVVNDTCPIMPEHAVDPEGPVAEYNGANVGFCCAGCPDKWEALSDAEKQAYIEKEIAEARESASAAGAVNMGVINATCPIMGGKVNEAVTVDYNGHKVGFCCKGCIDGWNALSDEEKAAAINASHEGDANLGTVGGGACDGTKPCCTEGEKPAEQTVNPGVIGAPKDGACGSGGCCAQQKEQILN